MVIYRPLNLGLILAVILDLLKFLYKFVEKQKLFLFPLLFGIKQIVI